MGLNFRFYFKMSHFYRALGQYPIEQTGIKTFHEKPVLLSIQSAVSLFEFPKQNRFVIYRVRVGHKSLDTNSSHSVLT